MEHLLCASYERVQTLLSRTSLYSLNREGGRGEKTPSPALSQLSPQLGCDQGSELDLSEEWFGGSCRPEALAVQPGTRHLLAWEQLTYPAPAPILI